MTTKVGGINPNIKVKDSDEYVEKNVKKRFEWPLFVIAFSSFYELRFMSLKDYKSIPRNSRFTF